MKFPARRALRLPLMFSLITTLLASCKPTPYETPDYSVRTSDGAFEIRHYPDSTLITTPMNEPGQDGAFRRLFRFISGRNGHSEKIAMTVPVLMSGSSAGTMSFVVPRKVALRGVPKPADPSVTITGMPGGDYASYRFAGRAHRREQEAAADKLAEWLRARGLKASGSPLLAVYNPPWTPGFLRRNEVLVRIANAPADR
jgi:SOUL heme-binding protein